MRRPPGLAIAALGALLAGCAAAGSHASPGRSGAPVQPARPAGTASVPGCTTATAAARRLHGVPTALENVHGSPFGVTVSPDGRWSFVALPGSVAVYRDTSDALPQLVRTVSVPGGSAGVAVTSDGRYLLVASDGGDAVVVNTAKAEDGAAHPVAGTLASKGDGAIEVAVSRDNRFAFVSVEYSDEIAVFNLARALAHGFSRADFVGDIPLGPATVGSVVSPDGRWLYATSEGSSGRPGTDAGTVSVISVARAETDPARSVVATVTAGCEPVRVTTSADGAVVWVTARASDALLAFSARLLRTHPAAALVADVRVGEAPVGLALVDNGRRVVVADSNRFDARGEHASLAVVAVPAALTGGRALLGYLPAGLFPREMKLEPNGRVLLVTNYASGQLEAVSLSGLR